MPSSMTRSQAKRRTLLAQGAGALVLAGGVALGITGLPEQSVPAGDAIRAGGSIPLMNTEQPGGGDVSAADRPRVHVGSLAERLAMVDNAPDLPEDPDDPDENEIEVVSNPEDPGVGDIVKRLRYIGYVAETGTHAAFIRIDGKQRIVREGGIVPSIDGSFADLTVTTIRPRFLIATDGEIDAKIRLGTRTGQAITMANGNEITAAQAKVQAKEAVYDERILGDPDRMPQRELDRRRRNLERGLRGENPRTEAARLKEPPVSNTMNLKDSRRENQRKSDD